MAWVFDCSVTLTWCFEDERKNETMALLDRLEVEAATVPNLWPLEVANVLSLAMRKRQPRLTADKRAKFLEFLQSAAIEVDTLTSEYAWGPIMALADRHELTIYDAAYLELALRLDVELATLDEELREAAAAEGITVIP